MNLIELIGVDKRFGDKIVYRDLSLVVKRGETLALVGPSGIGKSVLLKLIIGLFRPDRGQIIFDGVDVTPLREPELRMLRRRVGMLFQGAALFDSLTVGDNVAYGLREHYDWGEPRIRARVAECLSWVGLPGIEHLAPAALSGGMKKRVGLARVLAPGPEVILYDEPTTGLDPANFRRIDELIVDMREKLGVTSIVITHDMECVFAVADRVGLVSGHRVPFVVDVGAARQTPELQRFVQGEELT
jgi:phospholipid/cholesterol/gamma-HCH transport system ATP-binding protein